ncbi:MAG: hypothetical protein R3C15_24225, partial [Thermoleophilia bacterium]
MPADPLDALRAADPARRLQPLSPAELDAVRASIPTPPVPTHRRAPARHGRRTLAIALALAVAIAAGAAVASGVRPWERDPARQAGPDTAKEVFAREYAEAQEALTMPPGTPWPARSAPEDSIIPTGRGGLGESSAVFASLVAWQCYVVDAHDRGDAAGVAAGVAALDDLVANHVVDVPGGTPEDGAAPSDLPGPIAQFAAGEEPTQAMFDRWIRSAERGDVSQLRQACLA